jgi:hypothetical protein
MLLSMQTAARPRLLLARCPAFSNHHRPRPSDGGNHGGIRARGAVHRLTASDWNPASVHCEEHSTLAECVTVNCRRPWSIRCQAEQQWSAASPSQRLAKLQPLLPANLHNTSSGQRHEKLTSRASAAAEEKPAHGQWLPAGACSGQGRRGPRSDGEPAEPLPRRLQWSPVASADTMRRSTVADLPTAWHWVARGRQLMFRVSRGWPFGVQHPRGPKSCPLTNFRRVDLATHQLIRGRGNMLTPKPPGAGREGRITDATERRLSRSQWATCCAPLSGSTGQGSSLSDNHPFRIERRITRPPVMLSEPRAAVVAGPPRERCSMSRPRAAVCF